MTLLSNRIEKQRQLIIALKKYKRGVVRTLLSPKHCSIKNVKWTTSRIGDIGTFIKGAPLSKADISLEGTPFILYGELYTTYNEVISNVVRKTQASVDKQYYSQIGDVIIPTSGETPEEISTASCVMLPDIILAGDLNIYRCTQVDRKDISGSRCRLESTTIFLMNKRTPSGRMRTFSNMGGVFQTLHLRACKLFLCCFDSRHRLIR